MTRTTLGITITTLVVGIGLGFARSADAQSDPIANCVSQWVASCSADCATARCVSNCTTQAHAVCEKNITAPQNVFSGPVTATPMQCEAPPVSACTSPVLPTDPTLSPDAADTATCSSVSGTVADKNLCGGNVTVYVICPPGSPAGLGTEAVTASVLGQIQSDPNSCGFTMSVTNSCGGPTGCYGLIAVTPLLPSSDPVWGSCTSGPCPTPKQ